MEDATAGGDQLLLKAGDLQGTRLIKAWGLNVSLGCPRPKNASGDLIGDGLTRLLRVLDAEQGDMSGGLIVGWGESRVRKDR